MAKHFLSEYYVLHEYSGIKVNDPEAKKPSNTDTSDICIAFRMIIYLKDQSVRRSVRRNVQLVATKKLISQSRRYPLSLLVV